MIFSVESDDLALHIYILALHIIDLLLFFSLLHVWFAKDTGSIVAIVTK